MNKPLVIYHKDCSDGVAAAWCFWKQFGDSMEYHPGVYNEPAPDVYNRDVYLVDFSYKRDVVEAVCKFANKVVLLDHHKSALEDLWDLAALPNFDMTHSKEGMSGAIIAWNYVKGVTGHKRKMPVLLEHIQDRDMWWFKLPHTNEIMMAVFSYPFDIQTYDKLMGLNKSSIKGLVKEGEVLNRKFKMDLIKNIEATKRDMEIAGYIVPVANLNYIYASSGGDLLSKDKPFAATYYDTDKHRVFSLRSQNSGIDVSEIAKKFNGGGHRNASGFKVDRDHPLAKI